MQTVAQLIEALKAFPPEMRVIVDGYEGGFDDVAAVQLQVIAVGKTSAYCGAHSDAESGDPEGDYPRETCVLVSGL